MSDNEDPKRNMDLNKLLQLMTTVIDGKDLSSLPVPEEVTKPKPPPVVNDSNIPLMKPSTTLENPSLFVHAWPVLQNLMEQPLMTWIPLLFPNHVVPNDKIWEAYDLLKKMNLSPRFEQSLDNRQERKTALIQFELILRRAIVCLQCGLGFHAWSDIMQVQSFLPSQSNTGPSNSTVGVLSLSPCEIELVKVLALMEMKDCRQSNSSTFSNFLIMLHNNQGKIGYENDRRRPQNMLNPTDGLCRALNELCIQGDSETTDKNGVSSNSSLVEQDVDIALDTTIERDRKHKEIRERNKIAMVPMIADLTTKTCHMALSMMSMHQNSTDLWSDFYLQTALLLLDTSSVANQILGLCDRELDIRPSVHMNPMIVVIVRFFFMMHLDLFERYQRFLQIVSTNPSLASECEIHEVGRSCMELILSECKLPFENRSLPGGDREPNNVLRTLFSLRQKEMKNVRLCVDTEKGGFKLVAKREIEIADTFLMEKPFAWFKGITCSIDSTACPHCLGDMPTSIVRCALCKEGYCSDRCKQQAYQQYHRKLCIKTESGAGWKRFVDSLELDQCKGGFGTNICLSLKLMVIAESEGMNSALEMPEIKLLHRINDTTNDVSTGTGSARPTMNWMRAEKIRSLVGRFHYYCPTLLKHMNMLDFTILHSVIASNTIGDRDDDNQDDPTNGFVSAVHLVSSFANHSCDENTIYFTTNPFQKGYPPIPAFQSHDKHSVKFVAIKPIAAGEEITISYVPLGRSYEKRQFELKETYGINCCCSKCIKEAPSSSSRKLGDVTIG